MVDAEMTLHTTPPVRTKPRGEGCMGQADRAMAGAARRQPGGLRGEPRRQHGDDDGRALPATIT